MRISKKELQLQPILAEVLLTPGLQRPEPPPGLSKRNAQVWRDLVGSMPAGWFSPETHPLLEFLCYHIVVCERTQEMLNRRNLTPGQFTALSSSLRAETNTVVSLYTQLRLSPKSRQEATPKDTSHTRGERLPWEPPVAIRAHLD